MPPQGPRILRASWISRCMMVTRFACMAHRLLNVLVNTGAKQSVRSTRTRPQRDEPSTLRLPLVKRGEQNFAIADPHYCNPPCQLSCPRQFDGPKNNRECHVCNSNKRKHAQVGQKAASEATDPSTSGTSESP